jgi:hypothetical protein
MGRVAPLLRAFVLSAAAAALFADFVTSYLALSSSPLRFAEASPLVAALIASFGLALGLALSVLARGAVFALAALAAARYSRLALPLLAFVAGGTVYTSWLALGNLLLIWQNHG